MTQGIFEAEVTDTFLNFDGPQPDIYSFSIWTLSNYGVYSSVPNMDIITTNYRLGDYLESDGTLGPDGCVEFAPEFVMMSLAYNKSSPDVLFNEYLDIAPTSNGLSDGYPMPDGNNNFEDLVIFSFNYAWSRANPACTYSKSAGGEALAVNVSEATVLAEMPAQVRIGSEFTIPIKLENPSGIMAYHMIFDYDRSALEVVNIIPGAAYDGLDQSFFYVEEESDAIDIHSAILGRADFADQELALITFRATASGAVELKDELLDLRDWDLNRPEVLFNVTATADGLPVEFALSQNYPNPFNPTTAIELSLPVASSYTLTIYNILGQVVETFEGYSDRGYQTINWDASKQASGIYLYKIEAGSFTATRKMILLK
jgi:hypothetical protein